MEKDFKYIIVIPTHRIKFLKENLESIINQTKDNVKAAPDRYVDLWLLD